MPPWDRSWDFSCHKGAGSRFGVHRSDTPTWDSEQEASAQKDRALHGVHAAEHSRRIFCSQGQRSQVAFKHQSQGRWRGICAQRCILFGIESGHGSLSVGLQACSSRPPRDSVSHLMFLNQSFSCLNCLGWVSDVYNWEPRWWSQLYELQMTEAQRKFAGLQNQNNPGECSFRYG